MGAREDIKAVIKELQKRRKFKNQATVAEFLGYNASYFSRALNTEIPIDLEDKFFKAFPKSEYLNPFSPSEPNNLPDPMQQLDKVMEKQVNYKKTNITAIPTENYMMVEYQDLATAAGVMGGETIDALPDTSRRTTEFKDKTLGFLAENH